MDKPPRPHSQPPPSQPPPSTTSSAAAAAAAAAVSPPVPPPKPRRTRHRIHAALHYDSLPTAPPAMCGRTDENIFQFPAVATRARHLSASPKPREEKDLPVCHHGKHSCFFCQPYRADRGTIEPLKNRLNSAIEAMDQLTRTYAMLEGMLERKLATITDVEEEDEHEQQVAASTSAAAAAAVAAAKTSSPATSPTNDTDFELEHSLTWLESLFGTELVPPTKQGKFKRIRERSKSMMDDEINMYLKGDRQLKITSTGPYLLRRQSTYSDNKSKVSKWTKVKAAFKWERANVPPNLEVERYLKVPISTTGGGSSADSNISSSSGNFFSETGGTPGTISSASSMDELHVEAGPRQAMRRHSSKSDSHTSPNFEVELRKSATDERLDAVKPSPSMPSKSSSNKSLRRSKAFSDFEVLPEDHVADIKSTGNRRTKLPPSPLNLNQVCSDLPQLHSPLKSPRDGSQTVPRMRHVSSPGNSSVPSSPSRHSDYYGEFESEDVSSGDFSEPTTPNRKTFLQPEQEIFQLYKLLQIKIDTELQQKLNERASACNHSVKLGSSSGGGSGSGKRSSEEHSPTQLLHSELMSTEQLEQNLTPQFKKKLHKWRAKQQHCIPNSYSTTEPASSPTAKSQSAADLKPKIDWNLWSLGALKLEGQGLCALPDQKDLPEKFQKKLEQWNRLKCPAIGGTNSDNDSLKRSSKHSQSTRRGSDDDRWYKHKPHDKEKLARLKAIVAPDHSCKKIEVKTSAGEVMKFEGISRKFTRKLYEWEKARGIGPEASTFALLHPGYCPIDVRRINKECNKVAAEHSPTLSRSLSLDSVTPNVNQVQVISQQASSLSLNDMNELKEMQDCVDSTDHEEFKKYDEPEAVMVEVEEHIHDTASPLVTAHTLVEQQTPIYKYEEEQCYVNSRRVQSFESHTNLAPLLGALKRADELFGQLRDASPDIVEQATMRECQTALLSIRHIYPYYANNLMKPSVLNAVSDVQSELGRLTELCLKSPLDEACCQETMEERHIEYMEELHGLHESLLCLKLSIQGGSNRYLRDIVPDINITAEDGQQLETSSSYATCDATSRDHLTLDEHSAASPSPSPMEHETETSTTTGTLCRAPPPSAPSTSTNNNNTKKKLRLRKMGSRQNSKTESDSSDADTHSVLETPRRMRRKNFRLKQRSLDDDFRLGPFPAPSSTNASTTAAPAPAAPAPPPPPASETDDIVCGSLKVKPGERIEASHSIASSVNLVQPVSKLPAFVPPPLPEHARSYNTNANVFVKTKRKLFTTVAEPTAAEGIALIEKELESPTHSPEEAAQSAQPTTSTKHSTLKSLLPRPLSLYKSISLERLWPFRSRHSLRKCQSSENVRRASTRVRPPLASDSMQRLARSKRHVSSTPAFPQAPPRRSHLFKKNSLHKSQSATVTNNIEHKIAKTSSGSLVSKVFPISTTGSLLLPNKQDNTLPRIQRKLDGKGKPLLTPTKPKHFEFPPVLLEPCERPATPLSERARRLQQAKAQFLQSAPVTPRQEPTTPIASAAAAVLHKSVSVGSMRGDTVCSTEQLHIQPPQREVTTDQESVSNSSAYDSLPRSVSRSGRISSKLGFATLASKLRRGGKKSKEPPAAPASGGAGSALSALCRQTLLADVIALPQVFVGERPPPSPNICIAPRNVQVHKSQSSPQAALGAGSSSSLHTSFEGLNKSLSEQYVRQLKESDV